MKKDSLKGIVTALKQEDCVILIGSGISVWSGLPSWKLLLDKLAGFMEKCGIDSSLVKREIADGDLLQAASYGFDRLTKPQITDFMTSACHYGEAEPHEIHKKILDLGVKCFITTNYDKLIEMGIEKWRTKEPAMVVTNRQLSEMGRILQARAENFVYKPHGDIEDVESIILTREQYRSLLLHGERHMALETLKTLMVSRPLVCIGFGLKDPDFLYIRDILSNIYQGNVRDHYAIMADVEEGEADYWERHYGIHLVGYETRMEPDGSRSHAPLLELLETLHDELHGILLKEENGKKEPDRTQSEIILALMRYAAGFRKYEKAETEFGIHIYRDSIHTKGFCIDKYNGSLVERFLTDNESRAVLVGAPGAGKSYAMRRAAASIAQELNDKCLEGSGFSDKTMPFAKNMDFRQIVVPVYIDLKLYDGDLEGMIEKEFSRTLPSEKVIGECQCKIFLDSFNEMPKQYWDNGKYLEDFKKVFAGSKHAVVVGSRTVDGLEAFGFPVYVLDEIDRDTIYTELAKRGMTIELNKVMQGILSKPFYFQYMISGKIDIKNILQPKHFYREFFWNLQKDFADRFGKRAEIGKALSVAAYRALDAGIEAFPAGFIYEGMDAQHIVQEMREKEEIVNWLIYKGIIVPHSNGTITFVHQTITEYLAAKELMGIYWRDQTIIREKVKCYRWDQAVFFMMNLLPNDRVEEFINHLFSIDFELVLRSVQYMEFQREEVIRRILEEIAENREIRLRHEDGIQDWLEYDLRISEENEKRIQRIIGLGGRIGGSAACCLWKLKGDAVKDELMELLFRRAADNFFCEGLGKILSQIVEEPDLKALLEMADHIQKISTTRGLDSREFSGFISALGLIMQKFEENYVLDIVAKRSESAELPAIRSKIFCAYLGKKKTALSFVMVVHLLTMGYREAPATMYLLMIVCEEELPWDIITKEHIDRLADCLHGHVYAFHALREILKNRTDLRDYVKQKAEFYDMLTRAAVLASIGTENQAEVFQILKWLPFAKEEEEGWEIPFYELLGEMELVWRGRENLFAQLLMLKKPKLLSGLMGSFLPPEIKGFRRCEIKNIDWWLDWIEELEQDKTGRWREWQSMQIAGFLTQYTGSKTKAEFLERFNNRNCPHRQILLKYIIPKLETRSDDFNEDGIEYILEDLKKNLHWDGFRHHFLARAADETFIRGKLIPLLEEADGVFKNNLLDIIKTAGKEHGKRYLV